MITGNEPTMPTNHSQSGIGLTKREYFAAMVMQGLMAVNNKGTFPSIEESLSAAGRISVLAAEILINELNKEK